MSSLPAPDRSARSSATRGLPEDMRAEVRLLSTALGRVVSDADGADLIADTEALRTLCIAAVDGDDEAFAQAEALVASFDSARAHELVRIFTVYFLLVNLTEERQRVRGLRRREGQVPLHEQVATDSLAAAVRALGAEVGEDEAAERLQHLRFHAVLTAHPTEARRRAVANALARVNEALDRRLDTRFGPGHVLEADEDLLTEIDVLWRTAQLRTTTPKPGDEVNTALRVVDSSFIDLVLTTYRRLHDQLAAAGHPTEVPAFVRLGTWIGGDRDGNPFVTAQATRAAATSAAELALERHARAAHEAAEALTVSDKRATPSPALRDMLAGIRTRSEETYQAAVAQAPLESHRVAVHLIAARLEATRQRQADLAYTDPDEAVADVRTVAASLEESGAARAAGNRLRALIWQLETFGFHLMELEVRQHSKVHRAALEWLRDERPEHERPEPPVAVDEVLATFRAISWARQRYGVRAAGRYIISFTTSAQDVADVFALAREAGVVDADGSGAVRVVPLFETHEDLRNAPTVLAQMMTLPEVRRQVQDAGELEVMLGYSDSSKDVGPVAATLALADAQRAMTAWARENDVTLTMFHGRGGSLGRGGGPAHRAILAQPAGSVDLRFKVTEQGEVINARYANPVIGARHVEQVASAALLAGAPSNERRDAQVDQRYAALREQLSEHSRVRFHQLVHAPGFAPWFAQVTPQDEIGLLSLGSRPARRGLSVESLEDLRAIPWNFAWAQSRINLTAWFGLGTACEKIGDVDLLREAYQSWPLFTTLVDNVEMALAKTDTRIGRRYLALGDDDELARLVLEEDELTRRWVQQLTGHHRLLEGHPILGRAIQLRNPYVDALSLLQLRALHTLRGEAGQETPDTQDQARSLLLLTLKGVAAGLQNTG